ncbi:MAG TPA: MopE-related protein [Polyangia bacterium]|nr:MopE-related protein [Polyangia bacterium]
MSLVVLAAGCHDRVYDFGGVLKPFDAAVAPTDASTFEASALPDSGYDVSGAGGTAGAAGAAGHAGAGGTAGTGVQFCDNNAAERLTDPFNCGKCLNSCAAPNSTPACNNGTCAVTCVGDFVDADKNVANGCECEPSNGGVEICDGLDNNCNGMTDEGFDFQTDTANCGACNHACTYPFATASCVLGVCQQGACLTGYYDRDPNVPGCETACQKTNGGVEICDGLDNDCNGKIDLEDPGLVPATITCNSKGACSGTAPTCGGASGWACVYTSKDYQQIEDTSKGCDGVDNDCDGVVDEAFDIGKSCTVGSGACAGAGTWVCDTTKSPPTNSHVCNGKMKTPGVEVCNGVDDDCDGEVDELDSVANRTTDDKIVYNAAQNVTMFAYEATRYDSTATDHGFDSTRRPCSIPGKQPWTNVTKEEAEAACEKIGKTGSGWRLCTVAEWFDLCNGSGNTTYPYGNSYIAKACNGFDFTQPNPAATVPTGSATMCVSDQSTAAGDELFDMSGNVKEWTITGAASTSATGPYELRGGAYDIASFVDNSVTPAVTRAPGLQCDSSIPAPTVPVRLPSVGFRCCHTGPLPAQ